jgi:hypothetical protein
VSFPTQNLPGNYQVEAGPDIQSLFGQPMSQVYTGAFTLLLPTISGTIFDTNGIPVAGVVLQPDGGLNGVTSDANGNYALGVPIGWNGSVSPALDPLILLPGSRSYTNVVASITNENYLAVTTVAPGITGGIDSTNLMLSWEGLAGVTYQLWSSTNLLDWTLHGGTLSGSNTYQIPIPVDGEPAQFFRVQASH